MPPPPQRPQPSNPAPAVFDATLRAVLDMGRSVETVTKQLDRAGSLFQRLPGVSGFGSGTGTPLPRVPTGPPPGDRPGKVPVANVILPVRLVRFDSQAYGQLATLLARVRPPAPANPLANRPGGSAFQNPLRPMTVAAAAATASITGMVRAGLSGTIEGNLLADQFTRLNRQIASAFLPVVDVLTDRMKRLNVVLANLDGGEQRKLMHAGLAVAGAGAFGGGLAALAPVLGPVMGMFTGLVPTLASLAAAGGPVTLILGAVAAAAAVAGAGLAYLVVVSKPVRDAMVDVWKALDKVWHATKPLREALYDIAATAAVWFFQELAREINAVASDPAFVSFLKDVAQALKDAAAAVPGFIDEVKRMRAELQGRLAEAGANPVVQGAAGGLPGVAIAKELMPLAMEMQHGRNLDAQLQQALEKGQPDGPNPFRDAAVAARQKEDKPPRRDVTPFQPGRSDAVAYVNQLQDNFLKGDAGNVPKRQLEELIAIKIGQQGALVVFEEIARQLGLNARPFLNGRPGGR